MVSDAHSALSRSFADALSPNSAGLLQNAECRLREEGQETTDEPPISWRSFDREFARGPRPEFCRSDRMQNGSMRFMQKSVSSTQCANCQNVEKRSKIQSLTLHRILESAKWGWLGLKLRQHSSEAESSVKTRILRANCTMVPERVAHLHFGLKLHNAVLEASEFNDQQNS